MDIKLITIENSKLVEKTVGHCTLANYEKSIARIATKFFGSNWEFRKEMPYALTKYAACTKGKAEGDVITIA